MLVLLLMLVLLGAHGSILSRRPVPPVSGKALEGKVGHHLPSRPIPGCWR